MILSYVPALPLARKNASSDSRHLRWWGASKPFTRGSLREILGHLQEPAKPVQTDKTLTDHDAQRDVRQSAWQPRGSGAGAATSRPHGLRALPSASRRDRDARPRGCTPPLG